MAKPAKRMGRPLGEPSKVVRLPVPVAALAKRLADKTLRADAFLDIAPQHRDERRGHADVTQYFT
jgi:hypothetical protein